MFKVYAIADCYYATRYLVKSITILESRSVIIDKDLLHCNTDIIISNDIIVNSRGIYDRHMRDCIAYGYGENDDMIKMLVSENNMLLEYIKKIECKYNVYPTERYVYDVYRSALLYRFKNANEKQLIYSILCVCIDRGLAITHNNAHINKTGSRLVPMYFINNELENFYYSKKGKWIRLTGVYDTIETEQQRAQFKDWTCDIKVCTQK